METSTTRSSIPRLAINNQCILPWVDKCGPVQTRNPVDSFSSGVIEMNNVIGFLGLFSALSIHKQSDGRSWNLRHLNKIIPFRGSRDIRWLPRWTGRTGGNRRCQILRRISPGRSENVGNTLLVSSSSFPVWGIPIVEELCSVRSNTRCSSADFGRCCGSVGSIRIISAFVQGFR